MKTRLDYLREQASEFCSELVKQGFTVYLAERGNYGFYTNSDRVPCVSFQCDWACGGVSVSGNYRTNKPRSTGTGWKMDEFATVENAGDYIKRRAPHWAVGDADWRYTTADEILKTYGPSSKYVEVAA